MSPGRVRSVGGPGGFPRVSGDEPLCALHARKVAKFSPRERG